MGARTRRFETRSIWDKATLRYVAVALAFVSELIHLWVLLDQYAIWVGRGVFFFVVAACQGALAVSLLFGYGRKTFTWGILLNLFVVLVWAFTRVAGLPAWTVLIPQPVGALDLTATTTELALGALLARLRWDLPRKERLRTAGQNATAEPPTQQAQEGCPAVRPENTDTAIGCDGGRGSIGLARAFAAA